MWGMVGEVLRDEADSRMEKHIFTHRSLNIAYKGDKIIEVNLTSENPIPIEIGRKLEFTYSVHWHVSDKAFEDRFARYLEYDFFEHKIHWFSVFNSLMMVIFLCGLVGLILMRILHNDFARQVENKEEMHHHDALFLPLFLHCFVCCRHCGSFKISMTLILQCHRIW